jgi:hypothetical protein
LEGQPIRVVADGLGPAIVLAAILAFVVARHQVAEDEAEFARRQAAAEATGIPDRIERPTALMRFWKVENPDKAPPDETVRETAEGPRDRDETPRRPRRR